MVVTLCSIFFFLPVFHPRPSQSAACITQKRWHLPVQLRCETERRKWHWFFNWALCNFSFNLVCTEPLISILSSRRYTFLPLWFQFGLPDRVYIFAMCACRSESCTPVHSEGVWILRSWLHIGKWRWQYNSTHWCLWRGGFSCFCKKFKEKGMMN